MRVRTDLSAHELATRLSLQLDFIEASSPLYDDPHRARQQAVREMRAVLRAICAPDEQPKEALA
jgi:hypothetical protein